MIEYGYINENGCLVSEILRDYTERVCDGNGSIREVVVTEAEQAARLIAKGWKPVDKVDASRLKTVGEFEGVSLIPIDNGDRIGYLYNVETDKRLIAKKIESYKRELAESDYKVTKCYEASLVGKGLPYDIEALHNERENLRENINSLECMCL